VQVNLTTSVPDARTLREAVAVYHAAFAQPPYGETAEMAEALTERVQRYAREREGFRLVTAARDDGQLIAIALAVLARPGGWWRDKVVSALPPPLAGSWLGELCQEWCTWRSSRRPRGRASGGSSTTCSSPAARLRPPC
jgi:hypothetical protein